MYMKGKKSKRFLAILLSTLLVFSTLLINTASAQRLPGLSDLARMVGAEGIVLLENPNLSGVSNITNKVLPMNGGEKVSIFGRAQCNYYKSGTGSGGAVTVDYVNGILEGVRNNPKLNVNEALAKVYKDWVKTHPFDNGGGGWAAEPWSQAEMPLTEDIVTEAKATSDAAIVIIGRTAGEDKDNTNTAGAYQLTTTEIDMLNKVYAKFERVTIVLNVANVIDMNWVTNYPKSAVLYAWQGGMEGGSAVADVLTGDTTPSGKLADTIAKSITDYPSQGTYEGKTLFGSNSKNFYADDIYVGYRYFETFAKDKVLYPFGFGLSYTNFNIEKTGFSVNNDIVSVNVKVTNTGNIKGKEVVQLYYGAPQGVLGKPSRELAAFAKTSVLYPGDSQDLTINFKVSEMASYDDSGVTGKPYAYVLEPGDYNIYLGNSVRGASLAYTYNVPQLKVVEQLTRTMTPVDAFKRMKPGAVKEDGTYNVVSEDVPIDTQANVQAAINAKRTAHLPTAIPQTGGTSIKLKDVYNGTASMDQFIAQLTDQNLASIVLGEGMSPTKVPTQGTASCFGGVTNSLLNLGIPLGTAADGPSGIRMEVGSATAKTATSLPNGTLIACTWNLELVEQMSKVWGEEMLLNKIDTILGPGINIHRHPLNGRNFEYFSEDPLLTGMFAASMTRGLQEKGPVPTIKHYAANNQETNRHNVHSIVSERALREIYLKGYEIAVKDGNVHSVMTSYNPINGIWTASSFDLNTTILRDEWGFKGIVMTDWWAEMNSSIYSSMSQTNTPAMVRSQNDLYMVVGNNAAGSCTQYTNNMNEINNGTLTRGELQRSARNVLEFLMKTPAFAREQGFAFTADYTPGNRWFTVNGTNPGDPMLSGITVGGRNITTFNSLTVDYKVFVNPTKATEGVFPTVAATPKTGSTIKSITQATKDNQSSIITVSEGGNERIYKVIFSSEDGLPILFDNPKKAFLQNIIVNGNPLPGFNQEVTSYGYEWKEATLPTVVATPGEGVTITSQTTDDAQKLVSIRCASDDQAVVYTIKFASAPKSDDFNTTALSDFWKIGSSNPANWSLAASPGRLRINAELGDFWTTHNDLKNYFYQDAYGNWESTVKFEINKVPDANYNGFGVFAFDDMDNYVWLKYEYSGGRSIGFVSEINGAEPVATGTLTSDQITSLIGNATTIYMRMTKSGNTYTGAISADGYNYTSLNSFTASYNEPKLGILCSNGSGTSAGTFRADVDYVHFKPDESTGTVSDIRTNTTLKVAEMKPAIMTANPPVSVVLSNDTDKGLSFDSSSGEIGYKVRVLNDGNYNISARAKTNVASEVAQMSFSLYMGSKLLGTFPVNNTHNQWLTFESPEAINLTKGDYILKADFAGSGEGISLNWINFKYNGVEPPNTSYLEEAISRAEAIKLSDYDASKVSEFLSALNAAKVVLGNPQNQQQVDTTTEAIKKAVAQLKSNLPINAPPKAETTRIENGKKIVRVWFKDLPWIWAQSTDFRYEGNSSVSNAGYITTGDVFYLGYYDTTGLSEIKLNYSNGNTSSNQYQPSVKLDFFTSAVNEGNVTQTSTHSASAIKYEDVYRGGTFALENYFAGINFLHKKANGSWTLYGDCSTKGDINAAGTSTGMTNYWDVSQTASNRHTFFDSNMISGKQNIYMKLQEGGSNYRYVEFVYDLVDVSFNWNYDGAPAAPTKLTILKGTELGADLPTPSTRDGYIFTGWKNTAGAIVTATTPITGTTTLTAQWVRIMDIKKDANNVTLTASLISDKPVNGLVILAVYDASNVLLYANTTTTDIGETLSVTTVSIPLKEVVGGVTAKAFLWENSTLKPLRLPEEFNI